MQAEPEPLAEGEALVHGTCVAMGSRAVLLRGAPGSGKSDLALRLIAQYREGSEAAVLVADDQVRLSRDGAAITARTPGTIAGRIEVRGVGIVTLPHLDEARLALIADMAREVPRLPPDPLPRERVLGVDVPVITLDPFELSAPVKLALALTGRL